MAAKNETSSTTLAAAAVVVAAPRPSDAIVEAWFVETFHNRGLHVEDFNHFRRQVDALKARLAAAK